MARRRLIIKHVDPFTVLKFGAIANAAFFVILMVASIVVWLVIVRIGLIDRSCDIASDVGFADCGLKSSTYFLGATLLGILFAVVQTAMFVFFAFLHNLIADLTGGLSIGVVVEGLPERGGARDARPAPDPTPYLRPDATTGRAAPRPPLDDPGATRRLRYDPPEPPRRGDPRDEPLGGDPRGGLFDPR